MGRRILVFLWIVFVVALATLIITSKPELLTEPLQSFLRLSLGKKILIGILAWLASLVIGWSLFAYLDETFGWGIQDRYEDGGVLYFCIVWPPAWPILILFWRGNRR